jgi:Skp family chaperone for outer membrane proteins
MNNWAEDIGSLYRRTMEREQMMARLLSKIRTNQERMEAKMESMQEKMDANLKEMRASQEHLKEEIMAGQKTQIGCLTSRLKVNQEKAEACHEEMKACQEKTQAAIHYPIPVRGVNKTSGGKRSGM